MENHINHELLEQLEALKRTAWLPETVEGDAQYIGGTGIVVTPDFPEKLRGRDDRAGAGHEVLKQAEFDDC